MFGPFGGPAERPNFGVEFYIDGTGWATPGLAIQVNNVCARIEASFRTKHIGKTGWRKPAGATALAVVAISPPRIFSSGVGGGFHRLGFAVARGRPLPHGSVNSVPRLATILRPNDVVATCTDDPQSVGKTRPMSDVLDLSLIDPIPMLGQLVGGPAALLPVCRRRLRMSGPLFGRVGIAARSIRSFSAERYQVVPFPCRRTPVSIGETLGGGGRSLGRFRSGV